MFDLKDNVAGLNILSELPQGQYFGKIQLSGSDVRWLWSLEFSEDIGLQNDLCNIKNQVLAENTEREIYMGKTHKSKGKRKKRLF